MSEETTRVTRSERLASIPLFAGLSPESLERVAGLMAEFEVPAGHVLIQPGQEGSGMFIVEEGTVTVDLPGEKILQRGPGEFFGELALLAPGYRRTARVQALTPLRVLAISRQDFTKLLEEEPRIAVAMLPVLARRLAEMIRP